MRVRGDAAQQQGGSGRRREVDMFETNRPTIDARVPCRAHGQPGEPDPLYGPGEPSVAWTGAIACAFCMRLYLCEEHEKRVYPEVQADGFCICGTALFPNQDRVGEEGLYFSAQPKCGECAKILWKRQHPEPKTETTSP
jgi:hypothetical protein